VKLSDPGATAIIGAAAALAGVLLSSVMTLLIDIRRRRWEDRRRWDEARRRAYANFLYAARISHGIVDGSFEALIRLKECREAFEAAKEGRGGDIAGLEAELQAVTTRAESIWSRSDELDQRLGEASSEIYVIASRPVQDTAIALLEVLTGLSASMRSELESWTTDRLRAMRPELYKRWWKAGEDFQHAIAKELRVESRRGLRRRRASP
jgi:hypothetical protein